MKAKDSAAAAQFRGLLERWDIRTRGIGGLISFLIVHAVSNVLVKGDGETFGGERGQMRRFERRRISLGASLIHLFFALLILFELDMTGPISQRIAISRLHQGPDSMNSGMGHWEPYSRTEDGNFLLQSKRNSCDVTVRRKIIAMEMRIVVKRTGLNMVERYWQILVRRPRSSRFFFFY